MTHHDFDPSELLDALREHPDLDLVRQMVGFLYQALIEAEASEAIGAEPHERSATRTTRRNGHRSRTLSTKAGDVDLKIPKLRRGSFFPSVLERRRRVDQALYAVVMEAYVHGVSTRKVDDLVGALGSAAGISKSEVSRICAQLDEEMAEFRGRDLSHLAFPYLLWPHLREGSRRRTGGQPRRRGRHGRRPRRQPRGAGRRRRRLRGRGLLDRVPPELACSGPPRRPARHQRLAPRPQGRHHEGLPRGCLAALPGPACATCW